MGLILEDGRGKGYSSGVTDENRLMVDSVTASIEHHINHHDGMAFNLLINQSPTAADDCIAYILNSSEDDLCVEGLTLGVTNCTADDSIYFKIGDTGTRNSATSLTPVNLNAGSGHIATGTFEKGADLDGGSATLAGGTECERIVLAGVTDLVSKTFNFEQDIILPKNRSLTIWIGGSASGTYYLTLYMNYHPKEG